MFAAAGTAVIFLTAVLCIAQTKDNISAGERMPPLFVSMAVFLLLAFFCSAGGG